MSGSMAANCSLLSSGSMTSTAMCTVNTLIAVTQLHDCAEAIYIHCSIPTRSKLAVLCPPSLGYALGWCNPSFHCQSPSWTIAILCYATQFLHRQQCLHHTVIHSRDNLQNRMIFCRSRCLSLGVFLELLEQIADLLFLAHLGACAEPLIHPFLGLALGV